MPVEPSDPVVESYDVFLTDSQISRYVLQYVDRESDKAYDERRGQKPTAFRLKPRTGLVEVDVPINTRVNYDQAKGLQFGNALQRSRVSGGHGMAGGFSSGGGQPAATSASAGGGRGGPRVKAETENEQKRMQSQDLMKVQTLAGRVKVPEEGDPVYMLAAFRGSKCCDSFFFFFFFFCCCCCFSTGCSFSN